MVIFSQSSNLDKSQMCVQATKLLNFFSIVLFVCLHFFQTSKKTKRDKKEIFFIKSFFAVPTRSFFFFYLPLKNCKGKEHRRNSFTIHNWLLGCWKRFKKLKFLCPPNILTSFLMPMKWSRIVVTFMIHNSTHFSISFLYHSANKNAQISISIK